MKNSRKWVQLSSETIYENQWLTLRHDEVMLPSGKQGNYTFVEAAPFVAIVAVQGNKVLFVDQYRYPLKRIVKELPAGGIAQQEAPLSAAMRELYQETGFTADSWSSLGEFYQISSVSSQKGYIFLARSLSADNKHSRNQDEIHSASVIDLQDIDRSILDGTIMDGVTTAALYRAKLFIAKHPMMSA